MFLYDGDNPFGSINWWQLMDGYCDSFATQLNKKYPELEICALMKCDKDGNMITTKKGLIHMWCEDAKGYFYDARGKTDDKEEFFALFSDYLELTYYDELVPWLDENDNYLCEFQYYDQGEWQPTYEKDYAELKDGDKLAKAILSHPIAKKLYSPQITNFSEIDYGNNPNTTGKVTWLGNPARFTYYNAGDNVEKYQILMTSAEAQNLGLYWQKITN